MIFILKIFDSIKKVVKDDVVVAEKIEDVDINQQIVFDKVYMIGTKDYTSIGRPVVSAQVCIIDVHSMIYIIGLCNC